MRREGEEASVPLGATLSPSLSRGWAHRISAELRGSRLRPRATDKIVVEQHAGVVAEDGVVVQHERGNPALHFDAARSVRRRMRLTQGRRVLL